MKKVFLSLAVIASVAMVSCKKNNAAEGEAAAADTTKVEANTPDANADENAPADTTIILEENIELTDSTANA